MLVYSVVVRMIDVFLNECFGHVLLLGILSILNTQCCFTNVVPGQQDEFYTLIIHVT